MNTLETYIGSNHCPKGTEFTKEALEQKIVVLACVVQSLIDRIALKEGVQLGVLAVSACEPKFAIYEQPLVECAECHSKIPAEYTKAGCEFYSNDKGQICYACNLKQPERKML